MFIVKIPAVNSSLDTEGCARSGEAIIKELRKINVNEEGKEINVDKLDLEEIHIDNSDLELTNNLIYKNALNIFQTKSKNLPTACLNLPLQLKSHRIIQPQK